MHNLTEMDRDRGELDAALSRSHEVLSLLRQVGDRRNEGYAYYYLGGILWEKGELAEAKQQVQMGVAVLRDTGDRRLTLALSYLGGIEASLGNLAGAKSAFGEADALLREVTDPLSDAEYQLSRAI